MRKFFRKCRAISIKQIFSAFVIFAWAVSSASVFFGFVGKTERVTAAPVFKMDTGHYVGDGFSKSITGLGFSPELVIIKSDTTAIAAIFKTTAMPQTQTAYLGSAVTDATLNLIMLDPDGFTAFGTADTAGVIYTWTAFAGSDCTTSGKFCVGKYIGTNSTGTQNITTGFKPDLVWVKRTGAFAPTWTSTPMGNGVAQYFTATAQDASGTFFTSLNAEAPPGSGTGGFTVGATNNTLAGVFFYVAFKEEVGSIDVGTYNGDGISPHDITTVGFTPNFVFLKNSTLAASSVYSITESYGDSTSYFTASANTTNGITSLDLATDNGFRVGSDVIANGAGNAIYYAAFGGDVPITSSGTFTMASGTYTGDGGSKTFTNLGFAPDLVIVKGDGATAGVFRTSVMAGDVSAYLDSATANVAGAISMMNLNGFTVGSHASVNTNGRVYYWTAYGNAWKQSANTGASDFFVGAYTGNGINDRNITRLPFEPDMVTIKASTGGVAGTFKTTEMVGDLSGFFAGTAEGADSIQSLRIATADGFQIGTTANVNTLNTVYYYFGFKEGSNFDVGTYAGVVGAQDIPVAFEPDNIWVKRTTNTRGVSRTSDDIGDGALPFINVGNVAGAITGIIPTGFSVGNASAETNTNGASYRYVAWRNNSTPTTPIFKIQTGYYIGNGGSKTITGLGFTPQMVIVKPDTAAIASVFKTIAMPQNITAYLGSTGANVNLVEFVPDGFNVIGTANNANIRYTWTAFVGSDCSNASGVFCVGTYLGNGTSPRAISEVAFTPNLMWVKLSGAAPNWHSSLMANNVGQYFQAAAQEATGALFNGAGFTVGSTNNTNASIYYYAAFREVNDANGKIDVGTYNGTGAEQDVSGVGFTPDYAFTKNSAVAVAAVSSQGESNGDNATYFSAAINLPGSIKTLQSDGFKVGAQSAANGSGNIMYYAAFGGAQTLSSSGTFKMTSGSYVGNGGSRSFSNLDFSPDLVIIKGGDTAQRGMFRTRLMGGDSSADLGTASANIAGVITSLNQYGFTIGSDATVNTLNQVYYWTAYGNAWNPETGLGASDFVIGGYSGSGTDSRNINRLPIVPDMVVVKQNAAANGVWRTSAHSGDTSSYFIASADASNNIQALNSDGFQVGTNAIVNSSSVAGVYYYFGFKEGSNFDVGTYSGNGTTKNVSVAFQPDNLWVKHVGATRGIQRTKDMVADSALPFTAVTSLTGAVTNLISSGFSIGGAGETNISGINNYRYVAWKANVLSQTKYHWRADNGTETSATSLTGGVQNTPYTQIVPGTTYRLRMEVSNGGATTAAAQYRLEYGEKVTSCSAVSSWTRVGDANGDWDMSDSANLTNGANTTNIAQGTGGVTDDNPTFLSTNAGVRDTSDETSPISLAVNSFTELEYSIKATNNAPYGTIYCFRVSDAGSSLPGYSHYPEAVVPNDVWVDTLGSQVGSVTSGTANLHIGGAFTLTDQNGSHTVTSITLSENGTIDGQNDLDNIKLFYDLDTSAPYDCASESYGGGEAQFGGTDTTGFSGTDGTSVFTDSVAISTTATMCVYPVMDVVNTAHNNDTIEIEITSPRTEVVLASGTANPPYAVALNGTTLVKAFKMQTGYYMGTGIALTKSITGLGFTPDMVIIKADTALAQAAIWKTSAMPLNATAFLGSATLEANFIRLDADGFSITSTPNTVNVRYTWIAFSGSDCSSGGTFCVGSYSGTNSAGTQDLITGFQPDLVIIKQSAAAGSPNWRSSAMPSGYTQFFLATTQETAGAYFSGNFGATGFTVGGSNNTLNGNFYYAAFKEVAGVVDVGSYTGTAADNRNIDDTTGAGTTGLTFRPDFVFVKNANAGVAVSAMYNVNESYGDYSSYFITTTANVPDHIQALRTKGFQIGTSSSVNGNGNTLYYSAFGGAVPHTASGTFTMKTGSYVGAVGLPPITGLGFSPDLVIIKGTALAGVFRTKMMPGDSTAYLDSPTANITLAITSLDADGFTIGTHVNVNTAGTTYYWTAYGNAWNPETHIGAADFFIGAYFGNGIDLRDITRLPFEPDMVVIKRNTTNATANAVFKTSAMTSASTDLSGYFSNVIEAANLIQTMRIATADGFQVGTLGNVNTSAAMHWTFGFKTGPNFAVGSYTGAAGAQTFPAVPLSFQPDNLWVKKSAAVAANAVMRTSAVAGNIALPFVAAANPANAITNLSLGGFSVGNGVTETNTAGVVYRYVAWNGKKYNQSAYRWFANDNSTDVGAGLAIQDTKAQLTDTRQAFRLRKLLHVSNSNLFASGQNFKLQFATSTGICDASFVGEEYQDVTNTTFISYNTPNTPADNADITPNVAAGPTHDSDTIIPQTYEEANNFTNANTGGAPINQGQDGKWDFALVDNGAPAFTSYCFRAVKSDDTLLDTYTVIPEIKTADVPTFTQYYFRFFVDNDLLTPTDPWPAGAVDLGQIANITARDEPPAIGEKLRLRMNLTVGTKNLPISYQRFQLQYGKQVTSCSALTEPDWSYIGAPASGSVWRGVAATPVSGTAVTTSFLVNDSDRAGTYEESAIVSVVNPTAAAIGEHVEYDWILENNGGDSSSNYCFRMATATPNIMTGYANYPTIRTSGFRPKTENWRWYGDVASITPSAPLSDENVAPVDIAFEQPVKLRVAVRDTANVDGSQIKFKLQFSENSDFSYSVFDVKGQTECSGNMWCYYDGGGAENATITAKVLSGVGACAGGIGVGCGSHNEASSTPSTFSQSASALTEYEFTIQHAGARANQTYYFRLYDVVNDLPVPKNTGGGISYPSLSTEGATLSFGVSGLPEGTNTEGTVTTIGSTATSLPFGPLPFGDNVTVAQRFTISTNATEGYQIFVRALSDFISDGADIIAPITGTNAVPSLWTVGCDSGAEGCFGYHAGDDILAGGSNRFLPVGSFAKLSTTTSEEIAFSSVPVTNESVDIVYQTRVTIGQAIGNYTSTISYIVVPVF